MGDHDLAIVSSIIVFLTVLSFIDLLMPIAWQFITIQSLSWYSVETIAVAGTCVVSTGLPCAAALVIYTAASFLTTYFSTATSWITALILTPLSVILIIFIAKLARGQ